MSFQQPRHDFLIGPVGSSIMRGDGIDGWLIKSAAWLLALLVLLPVAVVAWRAFGDGGVAWGEVVENRLWSHIWQTILLVGSVVVLALVLGVPTAWLVSVYDFPGRRILLWVLLLPMAMPGFVAAVAYVDVLEGLIPFYIWVRQTWGVEMFLKVQVLAPWVFAVGVLGATLFPYVFLSCRAVFSKQAAGALESARLLGAGGCKGFFSVGVPMARPALVAGASLVAMEAMNDYGVVSAFGLTPLTPGIFRAWGEGEPVVAMRLAMVLLMLLGLGLMFERWQRGRRRFAVDATEGVLGRKRLPWWLGLAALGVCLVPIVLGFIVPGWRLASWAWASRDTAEWAEHARAGWNSFSLAAGAVLLVMVSAFVLVAGQRVLGSRTILVAQKIGLMGYGFPSALVAVGVGAVVLWVSQNVPGAGWLALSASVSGLMIAYWVRFLAVGIQPVGAGFEKLPGNLREAARTLGERPLGALWRVDFPLIWPAMIAGATLCFIDVFKELTLTLVLRPFDFETLATRTYRLTDEGRMAEAALPGLGLVILSLVVLIPLTRWMRGAER